MQTSGVEHSRSKKGKCEGPDCVVQGIKSPERMDGRGTGRAREICSDMVVR